MTFELNLKEQMYKLKYPKGHRNREVLENMRKWFVNNVTGYYIEGISYISFTNKDDAFAYKMRWL